MYATCTQNPTDYFIKIHILYVCMCMYSKYGVFMCMAVYHTTQHTKTMSIPSLIDHKLN